LLIYKFRPLGPSLVCFYS